MVLSNNNIVSRCLCLSICLLFCISAVHGHGDLHKRIQAVSKEIKMHPDSAFLYFKRGQLFLQHEEYSKSLVDFKICLERGYENPHMLIELSEAQYKLEHYKQSLDILNEVLAKDPANVRAHRLRGLVLMRSERYKEAALAFQTVIDTASGTMPENYIEAAVAWQKSEDEEKWCYASDVIHRGIEEIGPLMTYYLQLVQISEASGELSNKIYYQTHIIHISKRKERGYYERALSYIDMGKSNLATIDLVSSMKAIEGLNLRLRRMPAVLELKQQILAEQSRLQL